MTRRAAVGLAGGALLVLALLWWYRSRVESVPPGANWAAKPSADLLGRVGPDRHMRAAPALPPSIAADADPVGSLRLEGQVVDEAGGPVAGAIVTVSAVPPRSATSQSDGSFHVEGLVGRPYQVWARAGALIGGPVSFQLTGDSNPVIVRVGAGATVEATVVNAADGRPVAGAVVELAGATAAAGIAGDDGMTHLRGVESGWLLASATATGYAREERLVQVPVTTRAPIAVRLELQPGVSLSGTVVDERGAPVRGAVIRAMRAAELIPLAGSAAAGESAADGSFTVAAVAPGTYRLIATHPEMEPVGTAPIAVDTRGAGRTIAIEMRAGAVLAGTVVDTGGAPVSWATVRVGPEQARAGSSTRQVVADIDGRFRMSGLARQPTVVVASSAEASSEPARFDLAASGRVADARLTLSIAGTISGRVIDGRGEPVPEVQVSAFPDFWAGGLADDFHVRGDAAAMSGADGSFVFRGLPKGTFRIRALRSHTNAANARAGMIQGVQAATGDTNVEVVLHVDGGIRGTVRFQDGSPATVFSVAVSWPPGVPFSDDDGGFSLSAIPPGTFDLTFRGPEFAETVVLDVAVRADQITELGTVTVRRGRTVTGRVIDDGGVPVEGATVVVARQLVGDGTSLAPELGSGIDEQLSLRRTQTDAAGAYRIAGIASEELVIAAEHPDRGRSPGARLPPGEHDTSADLRLAPFGAIEGRATVGGKPAASATVVAAPTGRRNEGLIVSAGLDGRYVIERVPADSYDVLLQVGAGVGARTGGTSVTVTAGATARADIDIPVGEVALTVTLTGKDGAEISTGQVYVLAGTVTATNGKQLAASFVGRAPGAASMMKFVTGGAPAVFEDVVPGAYTVCVVPLAGSLDDPAFMQRVQARANELRVDCLPAAVAASPSAQEFTAMVAPMDPLID